MLLGLVVVRVLFGVWDSRSASDFQLGVRLSAVYHYLRQLCWLEGPRYVGPGAAGSGVLMLWLVLILHTAGTGLFLYSRPLAQWTAGAWLVTDALEAAHEGFAAATIVLALFHVAGILLDRFLHRDAV